MAVIKKPKDLVIPVGQKWCGGCGATHPKEDFSPSKRDRDGLKYACRAAVNKATRIRTAAKAVAEGRTQRRRPGCTPEGVPIPSGYKWCCGCGELHAVALFKANKSQKDGLNALCFKEANRLGLINRMTKAAKEGRTYYRRGHTPDGIPIPSGYKWCAGCGMVHPVEDFGPNAVTPDGLKWKCRKSVAEYEHARNVRLAEEEGRTLRRRAGYTPEDEPIPVRHEWCSGCSKVKADTEFGANAGRANGLQSLCSVCAREYAIPRTEREAAQRAQEVAWQNNMAAIWAVEQELKPGGVLHDLQPAGK